MSVKAYNKELDKFVKIASMQSNDIAVNKSDFVSNNVDDALSELKSEFKKLKSNIAWIYENGTQGGSGSGSDTYIQVENFLTINDNQYLIIDENANVAVEFRIVSKQITTFKVTISLGATITKTMTVRSNEKHTVSLGELSESGTHVVRISGVDAIGYPLDNWTGYVINGMLTIRTSFNSSAYYEMTSPITFNYYVGVADVFANNKLNVTYQFDNESEQTVSNPTANTTMFIRYNETGEVKTLGLHVLTIKASTPAADGVTMLQTLLSIPFLIASDTAIAVYVPTTARTNYSLGSTVNIPYDIITTKREYLYNIYYAILKVNEDGSLEHVYPTDGVDSPEGKYKCYVQENRSVDGTKIVSFDTSVNTMFHNNGPQKYALYLDGVHITDSSLKDVDHSLFYFNVVDYGGNFSPWVPVDKDDSNNGYTRIGEFNAITSLSTETETWRNLAPVQSDVTCTLYNCDGEVSGFVKDNKVDLVDPDNLGNLKLYGESYAKISFNPNAHQSYTFSFTYKFQDNGLNDSTILSCANYNLFEALLEGIWINQSSITYMYNGTSVSTYNVADEWIQCDIVREYIEIEGKDWLKIYINGVLTAAAKADHMTFGAISNEIYLGARHRVQTIDNANTDIFDKFGDVKIKFVRIYGSALSAKDIVRNYIVDNYYLNTSSDKTTFDNSANLALRRLNSFDDNGVFELGGNECGLPKVYVSFADSSVADQFRTATENTYAENDTIKDRRFGCNIRYVNADQSLTFDTSDTYEYGDTIGNAYIKLQGTSSLGYNRKNYDICLGTWDNTTNKHSVNEAVLFTPLYGSNKTTEQDWLPENAFTLKCDLMDSSHANNVGSANVVKDIYEASDLRLPPMDDTNYSNHASVKYAIDGFPVLLYIADRANGTDEYQFYGVYMFDLGRDTHYNLGLAKYTFELGANNVAENVEIIETPNTYAYEANANSSEDASAFAQVDTTLIKNSWAHRYPVDANGGIVNNDEGVAAMSSMIRTVVFATGKDIYNLTSDGTSDGTVAEKCPSNGLQAFTDSGVIMKDHAIVYLIIAYALGMTDNLGKNLVMKSWGATNTSDDRWYTTFYDLDTILGLSNNGEILWNASVDLDAFNEDGIKLQQNNTGMVDVVDASITYGEVNMPGRCKGGYNTSESRLWEALRQLYYAYGNGESFLATYAKLRNSGKLTADTLFAHYKKIINKIGQVYYNMDAEIKYLVEYNKTDSKDAMPNLQFMHGTRELLTKRWLKERIYYLDSRFGADQNVASLLPDSPTSKHTRIRTLRTGEQTQKYRIKSTSPVFVKLSMGTTSTSYINKLAGNGYYTELPFSFDASDIDIYVNNGPLIQYWLNINSTKVYHLATETLSSLIDLNLSGLTSLTGVEVDNCKALRYLNLQGCNGIAGDGGVASSINLSQCTNLQTVDVSNTTLTSLILPQYSTIKELYAANSALTELSLSGQIFLENVDLTNCQNLSSFKLTGCRNLKKLTITDSALTSILITGCPNLELVVFKNNRSLTQITFQNCQNIKKVDLSGCTNVAFGKYTGDFAVDYNNAVNLTGCPNLEELNLNGSSVQVIKLLSTTNSLKSLDARDSQLTLTCYEVTGGTNVGSTYAELPAVDLSRFEDMTYCKFTNNKQLRCVVGINNTANGVNNGKWDIDTTSMFANCDKLHRLTGTLILRSGKSGYEFSKIMNSPTFRLNDWTASPEIGTISAVHPFNLVIDTDALNSTFYQNYGITLDDAVYVMYKSNAVTSLNSTFDSTSLMSVNKTMHTTVVPNDIFSQLRNVTSINSVFYNAGLTGIFPSGTDDNGLFANNVNLKSCASAFRSNSFTTLPKGFEQVFSGPRASLQNCAHFLANNSLLKTAASQALDPTKFFQYTINLISCTNFLGVEFTDPALNLSEDQYLLASYSRDIKLTTINSERIFGRCSKLESTRSAFSCCNFQEGTLSNNVFGGIQSEFNGDDGIAYKISNKITDVAFTFWNSNIAMTLDTSVFSKLEKLVDASGCFGDNTKVIGNIEDLVTIFANNLDLTTCKRFFQDTGITGYINQIGSTLFRNNGQLIDCKCLFKNTAISGSYPSLMFKNCKNINNVNEIFSGCSQITGTIPADILHVHDENGNIFTTNCTSAVEVFKGNNKITGNIPANLFASMPNLTTIYGCFQDCGSSTDASVGITGVAAELLRDLRLLTNVSYLFSGCWALTGSMINGIEYFIDPDFFSTNTLITSARGLFQRTKPTNIPSNLFFNLSVLKDVSYMFNGANRSNMQISNEMFLKNHEITNAEYFMGDQYITSEYSYNGTIGVGLFRQYDIDLDTGQINLSNVQYAFAYNPNLTGNAPAPFWDETLWTKAPAIRTRCYYNTGCTDVDDNWK